MDEAKNIRPLREQLIIRPSLDMMGSLEAGPRHRLVFSGSFPPSGIDPHCHLAFSYSILIDFIFYFIFKLFAWQ